MHAPVPAASGPLARLRRRLAAIGPSWPLVVVTMAVPLLGASLLATTTTTWLPWVQGDPATALWFVPLGAFLAAFACLPTHATSLVAGFVYGGWFGALVAWCVIALGALVGQVLMKRLVGGRALQALADSPRALCVHRALLGRSTARAIWLIALLRLSPVMPFATTNLLLAAFAVRGRVFVAATALGVTPRAIAVAMVGAELQQLDWQKGAPPWTTIVAITATVVVFVVIGWLAKAALRAELAGAQAPAVGTGDAGPRA
ncbi:MAG: VTT domain-containing protein [Planctomycetes bacterium]|nr:VTT domain-containing protein [Planctomycetota bacterium]